MATSPRSRIVRLPTELVARYRAVDREYVGVPEGLGLVETPAHLDQLTGSIREHGIRVPLRLGFTDDVGFLDGNHRIAVALRLRLPDVPVELVEEAPGTRPGHAQPMQSADLAVIRAAFEAAG